ncbi:MAG: PilZ domain-containing protein [Candidatus Binatia bacterium]|nr:PilZ domain-containing protein [Candidatus Binatia bacterium]
MTAQETDRLKILPTDLPEAVRQTRRESRWHTVLPLHLITGSGELIPAVILNLSASGLLVLVDTRFSPLLPPPRGARFEIEFFLDDLAVRHAVIEVLRLERRSTYLMALGCQFVHVPPPISAALRAKSTTYRSPRQPER